MFLCCFGLGDWVKNQWFPFFSEVLDIKKTAEAVFFIIWVEGLINKT
jgi:hypothetical protein